MANAMRQHTPTRGPAQKNNGEGAIEVRVRVSRDALVRLERIARGVSMLAALAALAWRLLTAPWWPWSS